MLIKYLSPLDFFTKKMTDLHYTFRGKNFIIKYEGCFKSGNSDCFVLEYVEHDRPEVIIRILTANFFLLFFCLIMNLFCMCRCREKKLMFLN